MNAAAVTKYVHDPRRNLDWFWYAHSYMEAAKSLATASASSASGASIGTLHPPLLYNLRHSLELMLKFLAYSMECQQKTLSHHDIQDLLLQVDARFGELDDSTLNFASTSLGIDTGVIRSAVRGMAVRLEGVVMKYCFSEFLPQPVEDKNNELFRYPSTTSDGAFNCDALHTRVSAEEALADIETVSDSLWFFLLTFAKGEAGDHIIDVLSRIDAPCEVRGPGGTAIES